MKPRYNEGPRDYQNLFAIPRFRYIDVLLLLLGKLKNSAFKFVTYTENFFTEVRYVEVPL